MKNQYASTTLTINLAAIAENYNILKSNCSKNCLVSSVVKANAYGLGVDAVASRLAKEGCNIFFVANLDEAVELRGILTEAQIFVLHGLTEGQEEAFVNYEIIPVLNSSYQVDLWKQYSIIKQKKLSCALHFDTGMNRLGLRFSNYLEVGKDFSDYFDIKYIMSHLACADDKSHQLNREQLNEYQAIKSHFKGIKLSIANSSAIFLGEDYHFDMVRPGIALYGGNPAPYIANPMKNVINLTSKILQIEQVDRASTIGYGASHKLKLGMKIATIAAGYADGYLRSLSNVGICAVGGVIVPVIGRVSMDIVTLDVTNVPDPHLKIGAEVELIGDNIPVDIIAGKAGTIAYEILTSLGSRYKKVYI